jgi:hypothetical protein
LPQQRAAFPHSVAAFIEEVAMDNNLAILATMAALSAAFVIQAVHNLSPVIWKPIDIEVSAPCVDIDLNTGCALAGLTMDSLQSP